MISDFGFTAGYTCERAATSTIRRILPLIIIYLEIRYSRWTRMWTLNTLFKMLPLGYIDELSSFFGTLLISVGVMGVGRVFYMVKDARRWAL